ncbi:universal stress protein [Amycolatopsis mediterranei S699]|uniref:Universal stress protein n=2 Tax=Amycolatopsis mediterranei TaxID=33910 RepID=A0A0H3DAX5_AMYMU|nr:universal stress protein [Amycolatopsis mediterranei]ADJ47238.1 universal stress protein [Amycolatopsis mediterranei U32]AEK44062.1 universal stress protein [Amycolatopsis mediterranei S699]AFO78949.1 universal stress protein [Amycolatopsis mediterranei S699]AGT86077.1 universal stress protein [Amycolatopsis mediterranei RB]KDO04800.1 universal stress protein [Amycolatopsis mediterranei]
MTTTEPRITVGVDGSAGSAAAVAWAADIASRRHLQLKIVHGLQIAGLYYGGGMSGIGATTLFEAVQAEGERAIADARALAASVDKDLVIVTELPNDSPVPMLIDESRHARLLVVGRTGTGGFADMLLGGTAASVVGHAHCPVAVVRGRPENTAAPETGPVVVGVDGSPNSEQAIAVAFEEASLRGVPLVAVHAWNDITYEDTRGTARIRTQPETLEEGEQRLLTERLSGWQEKYPDVEIRRQLVRDRPRNVLLGASETAQLVVVGCRGRGGFTGMLLGSTSQALVHHASCPVLVVRPEPVK